MVVVVLGDLTDNCPTYGPAGLVIGLIRSGEICLLFSRPQIIT